jgi:exodeoxyribonuclease VII small subunit
MARSTKGQGLGGLERSLAELEQVVERLETGDLPLEQAVREFERGIKLTRECQTALQEVEQKVEILLRKTPEGEPEPFEPGVDTAGP